MALASWRARSLSATSAHMYEIHDDTHIFVKSTLANSYIAVLRHLTSPVSKLNDVWGYCKRDYCISEWA
jgi:hypothetical protein